ncbi:MAG: hypothetical protein KatS3mg108_0432 [Isosphaeraceae bacterium]|jgi:hypothetical protein|nr:MAG: hypothetical protein KatS3mg108_0432 [Isosphaeraceae bacterium]
MHEEVLIPLGVFAFVTAIVTVTTVSKQVGRHRDYAHKERLRALELGQPIPSTFWPSMAAIAMGAVVPIVALSIAFVASITHAGGEEVWAFAGMVGLTGIGCGTFLVTRLLRMTTTAGPGPSWNRPFESDWQPAKPEPLDPDAFDTVSRRG